MTIHMDETTWQPDPPSPVPVLRIVISTDTTLGQLYDLIKDYGSDDYVLRDIIRGQGANRVVHLFYENIGDEQ